MSIYDRPDVLTDSHRTSSAYPSSQEEGNTGVASLVCGLLSLVICGLILGPIAIWQSTKSDTGMAKAGGILGWIGTIGAIVVIVGVFAQLGS